MSRTYGIIPARLGSSRLHRKMLLAETGKPLIQYAWEAASRTKSLNEVLIATDSEEIANVARAFGARVELTAEHPSGSDRIAEVVRRACTDADIIVNIQGDEPEVDPAVIDRLTESLRSRPEVEMATLAAPIHSAAVLEDRSCVKVVRAADGRALYFSRLPIPFYRDGKPEDLMQGSNFGFSNLDYGSEEEPSEAGGFDSQSQISNLKSEISNLKSQISHSIPEIDSVRLKSKIENRKSKIQNPNLPLAPPHRPLRLSPRIPAGIHRDAAVPAGAAGEPGTVARSGSGGFDTRRDRAAPHSWHRYRR